MIHDLKIGGKVKVLASNPAYERRMGLILRIVEPFVATEQMKAAALFEMPLYTVQLEDGRNVRLRGRDLEVIESASSAPSPNLAHVRSDAEHRWTN